ncbi:MAG: hypothetical protein NC094_10535 [Bacteroidales bacterium]|nr:hypothetical protein [Lachnoclostridium sp.]MCM1384956.1 hypothetical protein [Lachnoclostridium sp.]MCM1465844.1 hypothetical protein [Bacteroidales bacterium]
MKKRFRKWFCKNNDLEEKVNIKENTEAFIQSFEELVKNGDIGTIKCLVKFMANSIQGELLSKCLYNDRNYGDYITNIKHSLLLDLSLKEYQKCDLRVDISLTPCISCVWNNKRLIKALIDINDFVGNPFNGIANSNNICACMIKPIGLVIVVNGNHSVSSAIVHGKGEIIVSEKIDIKPLLEKYRFNGKEYVDINTDMKIDCLSLKNNSEPFVYTLGLMFEMSRILYKHDLILDT